MAVSPADLLAPVGPVEEKLFPGEGDGVEGTDLFERLEEYIFQADAKTALLAFPDPDLATKTWALYLTFKAAYMVAVARPSTDNTMVEVLGSETYSKDQRDALRAMYEGYLDEYNALAAAVPSTSAVPTGLPSHTISLEFEY